MQISTLLTPFFPPSLWHVSRNKMKEAWRMDLHDTHKVQARLFSFPGPRRSSPLYGESWVESDATTDGRLARAGGPFRRRAERSEAKQSATSRLGTGRKAGVPGTDGWRGARKVARRVPRAAAAAARSGARLLSLLFAARAVSHSTRTDDACGAFRATRAVGSGNPSRSSLPFRLSCDAPPRKFRSPLALSPLTDRPLENASAARRAGHGQYRRPSPAGRVRRRRWHLPGRRHRRERSTAAECTRRPATGHLHP
jgi:hypothetical protein